jgi:hypothetical protein
LQGAKEVPSGAVPVISDNGPQFIAKDFKVLQDLGHDARPTPAVLPAIERRSSAGTNRSKGVHPARNTVVARNVGGLMQPVLRSRKGSSCARPAAWVENGGYEDIPLVTAR